MSDINTEKNAELDYKNEYYRLLEKLSKQDLIINSLIFYIKTLEEKSE